MASEMLLNGEFVPYEGATVSFNDRGYQFAEGVYEVIHVYAGRPFEMEAHMQRMETGLKALDIRLPFSLDELGEKCMELVRKNRLSDALIYIQISTGTAPRVHLRPEGLAPNWLVTATPTAPARDTWPETAIATITVPDDRWARCYLKTTMLLSNTLAKRKAVAAGADDAIFVRDGFALESTSSNLFAVYGGELWTPPRSNYILHGITRKVVVELTAELGIPLVEGAIPLDRLFQADEVFISASGIELVCVGTVDGKTTGSGKPGPVLKRLQAAFRKRTTGERG